MLLRPLLAAAALTLLGGGVRRPPRRPADSVTANVATPGAFHGYGFDQCLAPSQQAMNVWLRQSPYLAVGIYISGASRACRVQPNLTPTWVTTQLRNGWKLLPITLGPQASCNARFPRYGNDPRIKADPGTNGRYAKARRQGAAEADKTVAAAQALGLSPGSTIWYDLEGFDATKTRVPLLGDGVPQRVDARAPCLHYVSGVYSSAGSGIWMLDQARVKTPTAYHLPDQIWIARWDGEGQHVHDVHPRRGLAAGRTDEAVPRRAQRDGTAGSRSTSTATTSPSARRRRPSRRHCGGVPVDLADYPRVTDASDPALVKALQCLLTEQKAYAGRLNGRLDRGTLAAMNAWQKATASGCGRYWNRRRLDDAARDGPAAGAEVRVDRPVRPRPAAHPQRRDLRDEPPRHRHLRLPHRRGPAQPGSTPSRSASGVANPATWAALASALRRPSASVAR